MHYVFTRGAQIKPNHPRKIEGKQTNNSLLCPPYFDLNFEVKQLDLLLLKYERNRDHLLLAFNNCCMSRSSHSGVLSKHAGGGERRQGQTGNCFSDMLAENIEGSALFASMMSLSLHIPCVCGCGCGCVCVRVSL